MIFQETLIGEIHYHWHLSTVCQETLQIFPGKKTSRACFPDPSNRRRVLYIRGSMEGHKDPTLYKINEKQIMLKNFPESSTSLIHPSDLYCLQLCKDLAKRFTEDCLALESIQGRIFWARMSWSHSLWYTISFSIRTFDQWGCTDCGELVSKFWQYDFEA